MVPQGKVCPERIVSTNHCISGKCNTRGGKRFGQMGISKTILYKRITEKPNRRKLSRDASLQNLAIIESIRPSHLLQTCPSRCVSLGEPRPLEPRGPCLQHGLVKSSAFHTWEISALYSLLAIVRNDISSPGFLVIAVSIPSPFDQPRTSWS